MMRIEENFCDCCGCKMERVNSDNIYTLFGGVTEEFNFCFGNTRIEICKQCQRKVFNKAKELILLSTEFKLKVEKNRKIKNTTAKNKTICSQPSEDDQ
jgi:hypothetical protein